MCKYILYNESKHNILALVGKANKATLIVHKKQNAWKKQDVCLFSFFLLSHLRMPL
jgi:hypothetical protein